MRHDHPILNEIKALEEAIVGEMLQDAGCIDRLRADGVQGRGWSTPHLGAFFDLLCELVDRRLPTDSVELTFWLHRNPAHAVRVGDPWHATPRANPQTDEDRTLNAIGYLNHLVSVPIPFAFDRLYGEWKRRRLEDRIRQMGQRMQALPDVRGDLDTDGLLEEVETLSASIAGEVAPTATTDAATATRSARERYEERRALRMRGERIGTTTGIEILDNGDGMGLPGLFCLKPGSITLIAARPGVGKTSLATQIALNNLQMGKGVGVFSLEMTTDQLTDKLACQHADLNTRAVEQASLRPHEEERFLSALDNLSSLPLLIDETSAITPEALASKARRMRSQLRQRGASLDLLCIDYVQLMGGRAEREIDRVTQASKAITAIAKELSVPVLLVAQMNREVEKRRDKTPQMSDLADSSQLEKDAYNIIFIHREIDGAPTSDATLIVAKARGWGLGHYPVSFNSYSQSFFDGGRSR